MQASDALASLRGLFEFIQWIDYCYGADYEERTFDEKPDPRPKRWWWTPGKSRNRKACWMQKDAEIEALRKQIEQLSARYTAEKEQHQQERTFQPEDLSEFQDPQKFISMWI